MEQNLGIVLLKYQCNSEKCNLKTGYDEAIVGDALSLIKNVNDIDPCIITILKQDGWFN